MSDSNRVLLTYIKEVTWGETPSTPQMQSLRITGESLDNDIENKVSSEIRSDRQISDLIQTAKSASGDFNYEMSYASFNDFLQSALFSADWTAITVTGTDIAADATGLTSSSTNFVSAGFAAGQMVKVSGFTGNTANNTYYRVTSVTANDLNLSPAPAATDASGESVNVKTSFIRNGTTQTSFSIEKGFTDITEFFQFTGMVVDKMNLKVESQDIVTGSFSFMGKKGTLTSTSLDATPTDINSNPIVNAIGNVASIKEGNVEISTPNYVKGITLELSNNLRKKFAIGSDTPIDIGEGKCDVTGTMNTYFGNSDIVDKFIAGSKTSIDFRLTDSLGNTYLFDVPEVKFESAKTVAQGQDQDVFAEMGFRAIEDGVYGFTIQIAKFDV